MTVSSAILRELGAEVEPFKTVRGILFWLGEEMDRQMSPRPPPMEIGAALRNQEDVNRKLATLAAVIWHLHSARKDIDPRCWKRLFAWQLGWTQLDDAMAMEWGFRHFNDMRREMYRTEHVLREVFTKRGLLPEVT